MNLRFLETALSTIVLLLLLLPLSCHSLANIRPTTTTTSSDNKMVIRAPVETDIPAIKKVIDANQLFPSEMLDEMIRPSLKNDEESDDVWFVETAGTADTDAPSVKAVIYCGPEKMAQGTYNAWLLAVHPDCHRQGCGKRLMRHLEGHLTDAKNARILLVETSGNDEYDTARKFYRACGYSQEARVREFYGPNEDKIVYWKKF